MNLSCSTTSAFACTAWSDFIIIHDLPRPISVSEAAVATIVCWSIALPPTNAAAGGRLNHRVKPVRLNNNVGGVSLKQEIHLFLHLKKQF